MTSDPVLGAALDAGLIDDADTSAILYDLDVLDRQMERVRASFPPTAHHAVAVKSNPLVCVLREIAAAGLYAEAASAEELALARAAGFDGRTVWDSPAKTELEIAAAMTDPPWLVNVDSIAELDRYQAGDIRLGLRINPERRPNSISSLATGVAGSKFGIPISERVEIIDAFDREQRLTALHVHSGSNSRSLQPMVDGVAAVVELADEINGRSETSGRIDTIDIGGGLRFTQHGDEELSVERYAAMLQAQVPGLFDGRYRIVTEFGRFHHLGAGRTATRVEYVTPSSAHTSVVVHVGADSFVREVYDSEHWQVTIADRDRVSDVPGSTSELGFNVVGPLCFEGDVIARDVDGALPEPGDWLMLNDTGANTFSLWSRHCSRAFPVVLLYRSSDVVGSIHIAKRRESIDDAIAIWS
ncbi:MAG: diaminopimelate decarboxylase [Ilumatobacter sp.]